MAVINLTKLLKELNENKKLTREEKVEKVFNFAYRQICGIKKESWKDKLNKIDLLTEIGKEELKEADRIRLEEIAETIIREKFGRL